MPILYPDSTVGLTLTAGDTLQYTIHDNGSLKVLEVKQTVTEEITTITGNGYGGSIGPYATDKSILLVSTGGTVEYDTGTVTQAGLCDVLMNSSAMILSGAGAPVDYTDGDPAATGEGWATIGAIYVDTTNGKLYLNGGTEAEPVWKIVTSAA